MGYETKMWLCSHRSDSDFWNPIAMVDLGKLGTEGKLVELIQGNIAKAKKWGKKVGLYNSDGDTKRFEDPYGDPIVEHDIHDFYEAMKEDTVNPEPYIRSVIALALLEAFIRRVHGDGFCVVTEAH